MLARNEKIEAVAARSQPWEVELGRAPNGLLGDNANLTKLLGLKSGASLEDIIQIALLSPVEDLTSNHGKRIRGQLVHLGCRLVTEGNPSSVIAVKQCRTCAEVVELIHAGFLVVDDIEDGSRIRRGKPALHIRYGLPMALNAGNWLYFWPFELIRTLELPSETTLSVYEYYHRTRLRAHFGQATLLGPKWFDRVPLLIPLSWFTMSWAAWIIARRRTGAFQAVLLGTCLLVAWDLLLDPAMTRVTSYWIWVIRGTTTGCRGPTCWVGRLPVSCCWRCCASSRPNRKVIYHFRLFSIMVYFVNFLLPPGFCVLNGYWIAVFAGIGAVVAAFLIFGSGKASRLPRLHRRNYITNPVLPRGSGSS